MPSPGQRLLPDGSPPPRPGFPGPVAALEGLVAQQLGNSPHAPVLQKSWSTVATMEDCIKTHKTDCSRHHTPGTWGGERHRPLVVHQPPARLGSLG